MLFPNFQCDASLYVAHGTSVTVGPSFQLSYASLPFRASGTLGGLTLRRQFETAFALHSVTSKSSGGLPLDYLLIGTFNEHIAQPQKNGFGNPAAVSMGLEDDADATALWVDAYGAQ